MAPLHLCQNLKIHLLFYSEGYGPYRFQDLACFHTEVYQFYPPEYGSRAIRVLVDEPLALPAKWRKEFPEFQERFHPAPGIIARKEIEVFQVPPEPSGPVPLHSNARAPEGVKLPRSLVLPVPWDVLLYLPPFL